MTPDKPVQFVTDLLGQTVFINEPMNMGCDGRIRMVRILENGHIYLLVAVLSGAAAGDLLDLRIDQVKIKP